MDTDLKNSWWVPVWDNYVDWSEPKPEVLDTPEGGAAAER